MPHKTTLGRLVREGLNHTLDAKALCWQLLHETERDPQTHDLALRLERPLTWLCQTMEAAVQQSRVGSGPETQVQLELPFAAA